MQFCNSIGVDDMDVDVAPAVGDDPLPVAPGGGDDPLHVAPAVGDDPLPVAPAVVAVPAPVGGLFIHEPLEPEPKVLLETRQGNVVQIKKSLKTNDDIQQDEFKGYVPHFKKFDNPRDLKYNQWGLIDFLGQTTADHMFNELVRNGCDIVGVNHVLDEECSALFRRTAVKKVINIQGIPNIKAYYSVKSQKGGTKD